MNCVKTIMISCAFMYCCSSSSNSKVLDDLAPSDFGEWQIAVVKESPGSHASIDILDSEGRLIKSIIEPGRTWSLTWSSDGHSLGFMSDRLIAAQAPIAPPNDPFYQPPGHVFVMKPEDGQLTQITVGASKSWSPRIAPDGRQIVFLSDQESRGDLYLSPTQNPSITRLTKDKNWPLEGAQWLSPSEIMFNTFVGDTLEVFRMNVLDHTSKQVHLDAPQGSKAGYLAVSHNRKRLAFTIRDRNLDAQKGIINPQLYIIELDGGRRRRLTLRYS